MPKKLLNKQYFIAVILIPEPLQKKGELSIALCCWPVKKQARSQKSGIRGGAVTRVWGRSPERSKILYFFGKNNLILS